MNRVQKLINGLIGQRRRLRQNRGYCALRVLKISAALNGRPSATFEYGLLRFRPTSLRAMKILSGSFSTDLRASPNSASSTSSASFQLGAARG